MIGIDDAIATGLAVINKFIPDKTQAAAAAAEYQLAVLKGDQATQLAQADIDKTDAQSQDPLQHWRGGAGWVCVLGLLTQFVILPVYGAVTHQPAPVMDFGPLMTLMGGMLGLGGWHVYERTANRK